MAKNVDEYLQTLPLDKQAALVNLRKSIKGRCSKGGRNDQLSDSYL